MTDHAGEEVSATELDAELGPATEPAAAEEAAIEAVQLDVPVIARPRTKIKDQADPGDFGG